MVGIWSVSGREEASYLVWRAERNQRISEIYVCAYYGSVVAVEALHYESNFPNPAKYISLVESDWWTRSFRQGQHGTCLRLQFTTHGHDTKINTLRI